MNSEDLFYWPVASQKRAWRRRVGVAVGFLVGVTMLCTGVALAWPSPDTDATGGACQGGQRTPITWFVSNLETGNPGSPATITDVTVSGGFGVTAFTPQPLPNAGSSIATAQTVVPPEFAGNVILTYTMVWSGTDGTDSRTGSTAVHVDKCECPPTTTTVPSTTTIPKTTTTVIPTTTTQATTTTTVPVTTTTKAPTTTTTQQPTATTTATPTTTTPVTSTVPSTSTTGVPPTTPVPTTSTTVAPPSTTRTPPTTAAPVLIPPVSVVRPAELPVTGSETVPLMLIACGLIILGAMVLYTQARKSSES